MTPAAQAQELDLDELRAGTERRIMELREDRQRLSPEALTNPTAAKKLATVESDLATAEQALERVDLASTETERRNSEAQQQSDAQHRVEGLQRARELERDRRAAATAVDKTAAAFADALAKWDAITTGQEQALRQAGWNSQHAMSARPRPWMVENALRKALLDARCPSGILRIEPASTGAGVAALVDGDGRPIEATEAKQE